MKLLTILAAGALAFGALSTTNANAGPNLIVNGGFETGDFTGWTAVAVSYPIYVTSTPADVYAGVYAAQIAGYTYGPDTLTQVVSDTSGQNYALSFWVDQAPSNLTSANIIFDVNWDGSTVFSQVVPTSSGYQNYMVTVTGSGADTLEFVSANNPGLTFLDNVSLTSGIPEASTWAMMMLGFAGLGFAGYRKTKRGEPALSAA
jgi:hypothetical protein